MAYNRSVLRRALESLEAERLLSADVAAPLAVRLERVSLSDPRAPAVVLPAGWTREGASGSDPPVLAEADAGAAASPEGDFTVACRALWWRTAAVSPEQATRSYRLRENRLGIVYDIDGSFLPFGGGLLQLEVQAPEAKSRFVESVLPTWREALAARGR